MQEFDALSISQFCERHDLCRASFYNLIKCGKGPRTMKVGARTLISVEAAVEWRRRMEAETAEAAA
jgi:predicted DNA-binding transcriptional regulator AlpA